MRIKKAIASCLIVTLMSLFVSPMATNAEITTEKVSLYDFLSSTDDVQASYKYPSFQLTEKTKEKATLSSHTPITIRSTKTISTKDVTSGSTVNFSVASDVKDSYGNVLVKSGTPVTAKITFVRNKDMIGRSGELTINDFHTNAVDGSYVALSGTLSSKPDDKMTLSIVLSVLLCPLFLLMKGEEAQVTSGTTKTVYTVSDVYITP